MNKYTNKMKSTCPTRIPTQGGPTRPYSTTHVGPHVGSKRVRVGFVRVHFGSTRLFGYQIVDIGNTKWLRWGSRLTKGPNANGFAFWWYIGFRLSTHPFIHLSHRTRITPSSIRVSVSSKDCITDRGLGIWVYIGINNPCLRNKN